jgi:hypothetical protein
VSPAYRDRREELASREQNKGCERAGGRGLKVRERKRKKKDQMCDKLEREGATEPRLVMYKDMWMRLDNI